MATQIEEAVLDPHLRHAEEFPPQRGECLFQRIARRDEGAVEIGAVEARHVVALGAVALARLGDEDGQGQGGHHQFGQARRQRARERLGAFRRSDTLFDGVQKPLFARRQRRLGHRVAVKDHVSLAQGRKLRDHVGPVQPPHAEA